MSKNLKIILIILASLLVIGGSLAYGAMTARNQTQSPKVEPVKQTKPLTKVELEQKLVTELPAITTVLATAYPLIPTTYTIEQGQLFDKGQWFGTTLTYLGTDKDNRDTLRVVMEKKDGNWILLSKPPRPLLSAKDFPNVPVSILKKINQAVSLPGTDSSPTIGA